MVYAKASSYVGVGSACGVQTNDLSNVVIGEFPNEPLTDQPSFHTMGVVAEAVSPFEVGNNVVRFAPVDVVDLRKVLGIWNESGTDKTVNHDVFVLGGVPQVDVRVTFRVDGRTEHSSSEVAVPLNSLAAADHGLPISRKATNSANIADLIKSEKVWKFNRLPSFAHSDLSSAILDSPIMARGKRTWQ